MRVPRPNLLHRLRRRATGFRPLWRTRPARRRSVLRRRVQRNFLWVLTLAVFSIGALSPSSAQDEPTNGDGAVTDLTEADPDAEFLATQLATDDELTTDRAALSSLDDREVAVNGELATMHLDAEILSERIAYLEYAVANHAAVIEQARAEQHDLALRRTEVLIEIEATRVEAELLRDELVAKAVAAYMHPRNDSNADYLASDTVHEAEKKKVLIDTIADQDLSVIEHLALTEKALVENEATLAEMAEQAQQLWTAEQLAVDKLAADQAESTSLQLALAQRIANSQAVVADIEVKRQQLDREIAEREAQLHAIAQKRAQRRARCIERGGNVTDDGMEIDCTFLGTQPAPGSMAWPMFTAVTSPFGMRTHPVDGTERMHEGIDFEGSMGQAIMAAAPGEVFHVGWISGYGHTTMIDHGGGIETLYAHQSEFAVAEGDFVAAGDVVGFVGTSGNSTGPHLHFEVLVNGAPIDPMQYLP